jgi:hypothetical protein
MQDFKRREAAESAAGSSDKVSSFSSPGTGFANKY